MAASKNAIKLADEKEYEQAVAAFLPLYIKDPKEPKVTSEFLQLLMSIGLWNIYENVEDNKSKSTRDVGCYSSTRPDLVLNIEDVKDTVIGCITKSFQTKTNVPIDPHSANFLPLDGMQIKLLTEHYFKTHYGNVLRNTSHRLLTNKTKIRVGLLGCSMRDHAFGMLVRNWLRCNKLLPNGRLQIIGLSLCNDPDTHDTNHSYREDCVKFCHEFYDLTTIPDYETPQTVYKFIQDKTIDIIFDVNGHTANIIPDVMALKPANIIVSFTLGTPNTFGTTVHDYIFADTFTCPFPTSSPNVAEKIAYMNPSYFFASHTYDYPYLNFAERFFTREGHMMVVNGSKPIPALSDQEIEQLWTVYANKEKSTRIHNLTFYNGQQILQTDLKECNKEKSLVFTTRHEFGVPDKKFVYGSFNSFLKLDEATLDNWVKIVIGVENSVMVLLEYPKLGYCNVIQHIKTKYGRTTADRFFPLSFKDDTYKHMKRMVIIDLVLDTKICTGHTTTTDALGANVNVLTIQGAEWCSAVGASILNTLGLNELITIDDETFVQTGIKLGNDPQHVQNLSKSIQARKQSCFLWNGEKVASEIQRLCVIMMDRHDRHEIPTHIPPPNTFSFTKLDIKSITMDRQIYEGRNYTAWKGKFGDVLPATIKKVPFSSKGAHLIYTELKIQKTLKHPGIPLLFGAFAFENYAYFVAEICTCTLEDLIGQIELTRMQKSRFALQLLKSMEYLHAKNILHRNVCESNCLMATNGNLQLTNFGYAVVCLQRGIYHAFSMDHQNIAYVAPEVQKDWKYSFKSDVYAAATTIFYIFTTSKWPIPSKPTKVNIKSLLDHDRLFEDISTMTKLNPDDRPNITDLLNRSDYLFTDAKTTLGDLFKDNPTKPNDILPPSESDEPGSSKTRNIRAMTTRFQPEDKIAMDRFHYDFCDNYETVETEIKVGSQVMIRYGQCRGEVAIVKGLSENNLVALEFLQSDRMEADNLTHEIPLSAVINLSIQ